MNNYGNQVTTVVVLIIFWKPGNHSRFYYNIFKADVDSE